MSLMTWAYISDASHGKSIYEINHSSELGNLLFWDIRKAVEDERPNTKQLDWYLWEWKMSKAEMVEFLSQDKYKTKERHSSIINWTFEDGSKIEYDLYENAYIEEALDFVNKLPDTQDYYLVAYDDS